MSFSLADQLILARLSLSADAMTDDLDVITTVAAMSKDETAFEFLAGCWKREREERSKLLNRKVGTRELFKVSSSERSEMN